MEMRGPRKALETAMLDSMLQRLPARFAISTVLCTMVAAAFAEGLHGTEEFVADVLGRMKRGQDVDRATLDHVVDICESALDSAPEDTRAYPLFLKAARGRKRGQTPMTRVVEVEISGNVSIAERRVAP